MSIHYSSLVNRSRTEAYSELARYKAAKANWIPSIRLKDLPPIHSGINVPFHLLLHWQAA